MMTKIKEILLAIILILLILPSLQNRLNILKIKPLEGDFILAKKPVFSKQAWSTGAFQFNYNNWLEENIGLRPHFVRLNNQIDYSLYRITHAEGVIVGKKDVLFEYDYIRAYLGDDFIGKQTLDKKMRRLKFMQEFLKKEKNIHLLLILEPSKARYEPEYIPESFNPDQRTLSNYEYILELAGKHNIDHLDLNQYFLQMKDTASYPLYPQYGVHWSVYGMSQILDTLVNFIEYKTNLKLPDIYVDSIEITKELRETDYDAGKPLNLLWTLPHGEMAYPIFRFEENPAKDKPNVLTVADSYYWNIFNTKLPYYLFNNEAFWYFNALVYPDYYKEPLKVESLNLKTEVEKQDVILIMVTERFQFKYDWRFVDNIYELYTPNFEPDYHYRFENNVRMNLGTFDELAQQAIESELSLEEIIYNEADYIFSTENLSKYVEYAGPEYYIKTILSDTNWMQEVESKAKAKEITTDQMLELDANHMFNNQFPEVYKKYYGILKNKEVIRNDSIWMDSIRQKAAHYYLTIDEMVHQDAIWLYNNQNNK